MDRICTVIQARLLVSLVPLPRNAMGAMGASYCEFSLLPVVKVFAFDGHAWGFSKYLAALCPSSALHGLPSVSYEKDGGMDGHRCNGAPLMTGF